MRVYSLLAIGLVTLAHVFAQTEAARMMGSVTDSSGAVIPDAKVTITSEKTGIERTVRTNAQGLYFAVSLPPANAPATNSIPAQASL